MFSSNRKGVSEFIGYTYKRDYSPTAEVTQSPHSYIDPINDSAFSE